MTTERGAAYFDALCDLPLAAVVGACQHAARHWRPTKEERYFPVPATLREYAKQYREEQRQQAAQEARASLPQWSSTPDEEGLAAIRGILTKLGDQMEMTHPAYAAPSLDDPDKRRAELLAQARGLMGQDAYAEEEDRHANV